MSGNITSTVTNIEFLDNIGIQLVFTGTPTGTFAVQLSIDHAQNQQGVVSVAGTWTPITFSSTPAATGAAGSIYLDLNQLSAPWMRVVYTFGSSVGTLNSFISAKQV